MSRLSTVAMSTLVPALNVLSTTLPLTTFFSVVRTNAPPLPGLTCWNSITDQSPLSRSSTMPFLRSFVEAMSSESTDGSTAGSAPSKPLHRAGVVVGSGRPDGAEAESDGAGALLRRLHVLPQRQRHGIELAQELGLRPRPHTVGSREQGAQLGADVNGTCDSAGGRVEPRDAVLVPDDERVSRARDVDRRLEVGPVTAHAAGGRMDLQDDVVIAADHPDSRWGGGG